MQKKSRIQIRFARTENTFYTDTACNMTKGKGVYMHQRFKNV